MRLFIPFFLLGCFLFFSGCSEKPSVFTKKIEKDTGALSIKNTSAFLGAVTIGNILEHEIFVQASGGLDLYNLNVNLVTSDDFTFAGGTYPGTGGTCGSTLNSGDVCKIVVRFEPTKISSQSAQFNFTFSDSLASRSYSYLLTADSHPILTFEYGSSYDFGNKFVGSSTDLKIKISNTGRVIAQNITINNMSAPFSFKGGSYPGTGGDCGSQLSPGQNCSIIINYSPVSRGQHLQDIVLNYLNNGRTEGNTLHLIAWGFTPAVLSFTSSSDDFGTVASGYAHTKTFTLTHTSGDVAANLIALTGLTAPFSRTGGTCGSVLTIDQHSCTIIVTINSPLSSDWSTPFNLSYYNGIQTITATKTLTASTRIKPTLSFSISGNYDFGAVTRNTTSNATLTVTYVSGEIPATNLTFSTLAAPFSFNGGTCGTTLSSGTCTKNIKFSPTGNYKNPTILPELQVSYNDTLSTINAPVIYLKGSSDALLSNSSGSFSSTVTGTSTEKSITIFNYSGTSAINISARALSAPFAFKGGNYPGTGGNCGTTLAPAAPGTTYSSCTIVLLFSPTQEITSTQNLILDYNNGVQDTTLSISLSGTGAPAAMLSIENKSYPATGLNSEVPALSRVKVTNTGTVTATSMLLTLPAGFIYRGGSYPGTNGTCSLSYSLSGGSSCYIDLLFKPTIAKNYFETATMSYNNGATTTSATFTLDGIGENHSELYLSRYDTLNFPGTIYVGSSVTQTIQLGHGGSLVYATDILVSTSSADFSVISSTCPSMMINGEVCTLTVRFAPGSSGAKSATLNVNYQVNGVPMTETRTLTGTGYDPAVLTFSETTWNFGAQAINTSVDKVITVTKSGYPTLYANTVTAGSLAGTGFQYKGGTYPGSGGNCPTAFPATYTSCTVVLTFTPTSYATYNAQFKLTYNNGYTSVNSILPLSGTGKAKLTFNLSTYDFGQIIQSTNSEKTITISNPGPTTFTNLSKPILTAPFSYKGGVHPGTGGTCQTSLASNQSCTLVIVFAPTTTGVQSQSLTFTYDDGFIANAQSSATLQGEGIAQAIIGLSDGNPFNFGTTNINGTINKTFTLTNSGSVSGTNVALSFTSVFKFLGNDFPGTGGTCTTTISAGTSCTIVVSFTPTAATSYIGNMTLNYDDGLRTQTESKELRGTGSAVLSLEKFLGFITLRKFSALDLENFLNKKNYTSKIYKKIHLDDINSDGVEDQLIALNRSNFSFMGISGFNSKVLYKIPNYFAENYFQGIDVVKLPLDYNRDHLNDFLAAIYKRKDDSFELAGYTLFCARTGNVIEQFIH